MKKLLIVAAVLLLSLAFISCDNEPDHVHTAVSKVDAHAETCTATGNIEYYICSCGKLFADLQCTHEISNAEAVIPSKGGHAFGPSMWQTVEGEKTFGKKCSACGFFQEEEFPDYLCLTATENSDVMVNVVGELMRNPSLQYTYDGNSWSSVIFGNEIPLNAGDSIWFKGDNQLFSEDDNYVRFAILHGRVEASGNVMSLLDSTMKQTSVPNYAFHGLFSTNPLLMSAPKLPATTLGTGCYMGMFQGTSIKTAPELPADSVPQKGYEAMFKSCVSLESASLYANALAVDSCTEMFSGCQSLNLLHIGFKGWAFGATTDWVKNVALEGTAFIPVSLSEYADDSHIPSGWDVEYEGETSDLLCFRAELDGSTISFTNPTGVTRNILFSRDLGSWADFNSLTLAMNKGEKVWFMGDNSAISTKDYDAKFEMTGSFSASGTVMSLLSSDPENIPTTATDYCFKGLFKGQHSLLTAPLLTATKVCKSAYASMFEDTLITTAPALPAKELEGEGCYYSMFHNCTSLVDAPALPAEKLTSGCYRSMFDGCTSLLLAPDLPATELDEFCYAEMFYKCSNLVGAPVIAAEKMSYWGCYQMFSYCSSLEVAPALPATELAANCYGSMFNECILLEKAPALPASKLASACYSYMFNGCSSLEKAPALEATSLENDCYMGMFEGCSSLETAPHLPATVLKPYCYGYMFMNSGVTSVSVAFMDWLDGYDPTMQWLTMVPENGVFKCPALLEKISDPSGTYIPMGWTIETF